ncbi:hypothetical protein QR680_012322 [Steinernema hermaphroditum]|uniref:Nucleolar complex protein 2 homolog n=1 Tax=Steinernema hermaphroditum TaxID=289476 RepID=A0AA39LZN5_9BILA|nr:hypothetical protein QR680_012322 [Steinernema hermaphroditum]
MKIVVNDPEFAEFLKENDADLLGNDFIEEEDESQKEPEVETTVVVGGKLRLRKDQDGRSIVDDLVDFIEDHIKVDSGSGELKAQERVVRLAVKCFIACVARVGAKMDPPQFVVESQQVFERVVRLCFQQLTGCPYTLLGTVKADGNLKPNKTDNPDEVHGEQEEDEPEDQSDEDYDKQVQTQEPLAAEAFRSWKKYSAVVKQYLHHLTMFIDELRHDDVIFTTVKTIEQLAEIYIHFKILRKRVLKSLIRLWSQKSEKCRLIAFVAMSRFCKISDGLVPFVLKSCYVSYISNSRVVTPDTLPLISMMQRTYAELAMIRPAITYPYMFVYIRQCVHVRNAMIAKRKDMVQTVYNWQFIQSLYLWCEVICKASKYHGHEKDYRSVEELAFPFTQVVTQCSVKMRALCRRARLTTFYDFMPYDIFPEAAASEAMNPQYPADQYPEFTAVRERIQHLHVTPQWMTLFKQQPRQAMLSFLSTRRLLDLMRTVRADRERFEKLVQMRKKRDDPMSGGFKPIIYEEDTHPPKSSSSQSSIRGVPQQLQREQSSSQAAQRPKTMSRKRKIPESFVLRTAFESVACLD